MGLPLDEHVTNVIGFMREQADALGLRGYPLSPNDRRRPKLSVSTISRPG